MSEHCTPSELLDLFPKLKEQGWRPQAIGVLYSCGLVHGFRGVRESGKNDVVLINRHSFERLLKWRNEKLDEKKIDFRD